MGYQDLHLSWVDFVEVHDFVSYGSEGVIASLPSGFFRSHSKLSSQSVAVHLEDPKGVKALHPFCHDFAKFFAESLIFLSSSRSELVVHVHRMHREIQPELTAGPEIVFPKLLQRII